MQLWITDFDTLSKMQEKCWGKIMSQKNHTALTVVSAAKEKAAVVDMVGKNAIVQGTTAKTLIVVAEMLRQSLSVFLCNISV